MGAAPHSEPEAAELTASTSRRVGIRIARGLLGLLHMTSAAGLLWIINSGFADPDAPAPRLAFAGLWGLWIVTLIFSIALPGAPPIPRKTPPRELRMLTTLFSLAALAVFGVYLARPSTAIAAASIGLLIVSVGLRVITYLLSLPDPAQRENPAAGLIAQPIEWDADLPGRNRYIATVGGTQWTLQVDESNQGVRFILERGGRYVYEVPALPPSWLLRSGKDGDGHSR